MRNLSNATLGALLALTAYSVLAWNDAFIKALGSGIPTFEKAFFVSGTAMIGAGIALSLRGEISARTLRIPKDGWIVHLRASAAVSTTLCGIYAFTHISMAESYALVFLAPFISLVLAALLLKEQLPLTRKVAVLVGFIGVLVVVRPGFRTLEWGHLAAVGAAVSFAVASIATRKGAHVPRTTMLAYSFLYSVVFNGVVMLPRFQLPNWHEAGLLLGSGLCVGLGQICLVTAFHKTDASQVTPFHYTQMFWAMLFGAVFFDEMPDLFIVIGVALILVAGFLSFRAKTAQIPNPRVA